ncbi:T9SS type A sorting domain-containing protein [Ferruginibacter albus]|uniref:T9SS type A sorting domain-containing protein n=1 Tax=Ferruginibacter albus TaxID=2875540 RepID=UPI001CC353E4|nr:T9SS type A sorting domain-containing protein [Ferruginibacter albus]UAY50714.1 T9SS type A sorting domain-containing protein [Ferruginibacter albus]
MKMQHFNPISLCLLLLLTTTTYAGKSKATTNSPLAVEQFLTSLYAYNPDGSVSLNDGTLSLYASNYSNAVNPMEDAMKMKNFTENLAILRNGKSMAIEKRQPIGSTDTTFYTFNQMRKIPYRLDFTTINFNHPGLLAYLQDSYTGTSTLIDLTGGTTSYMFSITDDPASNNATRFMVIFSSVPQLLGGVVPVTFSSVMASQVNNTVSVEWKAENEINVAGYEVERSTNGIDFVKVADVSYNNSGKSSNAYNWSDVNIVDGNSYYRIKEIGKDGKTQYSKILKISNNKSNSSINVYPNPVVGKTIGLQLNNQISGTYKVRLVNNFGQVITTQTINHKGGSSTQTVSIDKNIGKGIYRLEVMDPAYKITSINIAF